MATGKSSSALHPSRDTRQWGGSSQPLTATLGWQTPHGNLKPRQELWENGCCGWTKFRYRAGEVMEKLGLGLKKVVRCNGSTENCLGAQPLCRNTQSLFKPSFQPQSTIQARPLHLCCHLLGTGRRDGIHLPGVTDQEPRGAAGRCGSLSSFQLPAARGSSPSPAAPTAEIRFCKQQSCQLIRRRRA